MSSPWAINTYSCFTRTRVAERMEPAEGARLSCQSHSNGNQGWPRKRVISKAKEELQDQRVREHRRRAKRYEWVCTWCDKRDFMFQAECRNCKADPTPVQKEQGSRKTEGIPPRTNTSSCTSKEGGRLQNMSEYRVDEKWTKSSTRLALRGKKLYRKSGNEPRDQTRKG